MVSPNRILLVTHIEFNVRERRRWWWWWWWWGPHSHSEVWAEGDPHHLQHVDAVVALGMNILLEIGEETA